MKYFQVNLNIFSLQSIKYFRRPGRHLFLPFRPSVLEPGLDLDLRQLESLGQLQPLGDGQVLVRLELGLQLVQLLGAVGLSRLPVHSGLPGSPSYWLRG